VEESAVGPRFGLPGAGEAPAAAKPAAPGLTCRELFRVFLKAGLAFGGGLGILAVLEEELVRRRRVVSREDFLATYALARVAPCGTSTALAVAFGHRFGGWPGTVAALGGLVLPGLSLVIALSAAYPWLADGPLLGLLAVTLLPAALAFAAVAALRLGREVFRPSADLLLAAAAFAGALLGAHPSLLLLAGGVAGVLALGRREGRGP
jgi:chromate transporter